jgi:hypothetical protein
MVTQLTNASLSDDDASSDVVTVTARLYVRKSTSREVLKEILR